MHFSPNTLHGLKQYWPFAVHTQTFSSGNKALEWLTTQNKTQKRQCFVDYLDLGISRLVCFFFCFCLFLWVFDSLGLIQINPDQSKPNLIHRAQGILVKSLLKKQSCILNMRSIPWGCAIFLFRCEAFRDVKNCKNVFLVKETVPSNKWCSSPSRAQLEFFERSVTYLQRNGVIERFVTYFQTMV